MNSYKDKADCLKELTENKLEEILYEAPIDSDVLEAMRYSLLGSGKRIRAILVLSACELCAGNADDAVFAACAVEMLHCYSLIHDDLPCMDNDDMRRGKPSCHKKFGETTALLAGDALLTLSFETLARIQDPVAAQKCVAVLAKAAGYVGMIRGQELDLEAEKRMINMDELTEVHKNKTGALIRASVKMGALCANASEAQRNALDIYAAKIGLVFQIVDDILDCTSDSATLGKPVGSDEKQNKSTYPKLIGIEKSRETAMMVTNEAVSALKNTFEVNDSDFLPVLANKLLIRIN